jgi:uncharacterized membrane protein YcaP (DUF421 family)
VLLDGEPTIVIKKGTIVKEALSSAKLKIDDLTMLLRNNNVFSVDEVDYAILEPNGQLSVLKKSGFEAVTKKDMKIPDITRLYIPSEIIVDGKLVERNLRELNLTKAWVDNELKLSGVASYENVLLAEIQSDGKLHINKTD